MARNDCWCWLDAIIDNAPTAEERAERRRQQEQKIACGCLGVFMILLVVSGLFSLGYWYGTY